MSFFGDLVRTAMGGNTPFWQNTQAASSAMSGGGGHPRQTPKAAAPATPVRAPVGGPPDPMGDPNVQAYLQSLNGLLNGGGGGGGGGFDASAYKMMGYGNIYDAAGELANMFNARTGGINSAYDQATGRLNETKVGATNEINQAQADFLRAFQQNEASYAREHSAIDRGIRSDQAETQRNLKADLAGVTADLQAQGGDVAAHTAQLAGALGQLQAQGQLDKDLSARMKSINNDQARDRKDASAGTTQAGQTTLQNNYSDILGRIEAERAKELASAEIAYQQGLMENNRQVAAQRAQVDQFNAQQSARAAAARQASQGQAQDPLDRAMALAKLQGMNLENSALAKSLQGEAPNTRDINDRVIGSEARDAIMMSNGDPNVAYQLLSAEKEHGDRSDEWLQNVNRQLMYYFNPQYSSNAYFSDMSSQTVAPALFAAFGR